MSSSVSNVQNPNKYSKEIEHLEDKLLQLNYSSSSIAQRHLSEQLLSDSAQHQYFIDTLEKELSRLNLLISEVNAISQEMHREIVYTVLLEIPPSYLKPDERVLEQLCCPLIEVKRDNFPLQIWDVEKFENRLNDIKILYDKWIQSEDKSEFLIKALKYDDPFFDDEFDSFVGVANIYFKALLYQSNVDYTVPIINTQGEMTGSLHVTMQQTGLPYNGAQEENNNKNPEVTIKFSIKEARNLPASNAEIVMCRYVFINPKLDQTVTSDKCSIDDNDNKQRIFMFNHENEYTFSITDKFLSTCLNGALSIEVWYHHNLKSKETAENNERTPYDRLTKEIGKLWKDVKRHVQLLVEIHELDSSGQWKPVEVHAHERIISGGVYRLKQGQTKRVALQLRPIPRSNAQSLIFREIRTVEIGSISARKFDAPIQLDSYQDEDLQILRDQWLDQIEKRKVYLESQINLLNQQTNKTAKDMHRENILLEERVRIVDEINIAQLPPVGSGIPGSPPCWNLPPTIEVHRPLIFLNIDPFTMHAPTEPAGFNSLLNEENQTPMVPLSLIHSATEKAHAMALWDPTIHDSAKINQVTSSDTLIYLIVRIRVLISKPVEMEILLRKRIAVTIGNKDGWWPEKKLKHLLGHTTHHSTSVVYEIVSSLPKKIYNMNDHNTSDYQRLSNDSIEKYIQLGLMIDSMILLNRLRQEVLIAENCSQHPTIPEATIASNIVVQNKNSMVDKSNQESVNTSNERISTLGRSEWNSSTPSMISRSLFIEEEISQRKEDTDITVTAQPAESQGEQLDDRIIANYSIGTRVIVNTGHSIVHKLGTIRFFGKICIQKGSWYGIELDEPIGKNNGSLQGISYFQCADKHGVFVRLDKLKLHNPN